MPLAARAALPSLVLAASLATSLVAPLAAQTPARRPIRATDIYHVREVSEPQRSPDGRWVAYVVTVLDSARDRSTSDLWMTSWRGDTTLQLTSSPESEGTPRWSPDGRYLSFLSSRPDAHDTQLWLLDRLGGEARRLTDVKGGIGDYAWSPDGRRLVLLVTDPEDTSSAPKPIVVDRYAFKSDGDGYLGARRDHLYLYELATRTLTRLTSGPYDDEEPAWSPDGRRIAFVSKRGEDPDRADDTNVYVVEARAGASPRQLTTFYGPDEGPLSWSPDGRLIAYRQGDAPRFSAYDVFQLAVVPADGGAARLVAPALDRSVTRPVWSADGRTIAVVVADDRTRYLARAGVADGTVQRVVDGQRVVGDFSQGPDGDVALVVTSSTQPGELFAAEGGALRRLSHQNDRWLAGVQLATTEGIEATSGDGTEVHGLLVKPAGYVAGRRYPTLLRIHGGPNSQDQFEFHLERELLAANGYVVVTANYRGSTGRGMAYGHAIVADWGNKEVQDLLAITDRVVALGVADSTRLGIGGWSYGAILTNYVIASDPRFKAATSGAGSSLQLAMYGTDQYVAQYDAELGPPWKNQEAWIRVSYPFFHADRITTPTLFLGGTADFNVPLLGSEQMYQALRSLGVPTQLVIYPGQHHGIARPSFKVDRLQRYVAWYDRYLKPSSGAAGR
ncbi:MAG TPA: S9 family peptidase [Gemmatimonadaceae bacterium]|nr:S9 family peptidase [Gemmatimonadaceae bacterium]